MALDGDAIKPVSEGELQEKLEFLRTAILNDVLATPTLPDLRVLPSSHQKGVKIAKKKFVNFCLKFN